MQSSKTGSAEPTDHKSNTSQNEILVDMERCFWCYESLPFEIRRFLSVALVDYDPIEIYNDVWLASGCDIADTLECLHDNERLVHQDNLYTPHDVQPLRHTRQLRSANSRRYARQARRHRHGRAF